MLYVLYFWVEPSVQRRRCLIFVKLWVPEKGPNSVVSGYPTSTSFSWVDSWSMDSRVLRHHIANEGQQPFVRDIQGGELRGLSHFLRLVSGSLLVSIMTFAGQLFSHRFVFLSQLICDHDRQGYCLDIVLQRQVSVCPPI